jgi:predicted PolB exonuclease-like 3'-5' exonuclease
MNTALERIIFLDIETVPALENYTLLDKNWQKLWDKKAQSLTKNPEQDAAEIYERAGIYAEFGKIVCISMGRFSLKEGVLSGKVRSIVGEDEKKILEEFQSLISAFDNKKYRFCAHNGKEFDYPFLGRRMLAKNIQLPKMLQINGKKPWEIDHLDTLQLWRFGDYKHYISLELLAETLQIDHHKIEIDGSQISTLFYKERNLEKIQKYCEQDVHLLAKIFVRMMQL